VSLAVLIVAVGILVAAYWLSGTRPFLAGVLAVVPVKIVATTAMSWQEGGRAGLRSSLDGVLTGQVIWTALIALAWIMLRE